MGNAGGEQAEIFQPLGLLEVGFAKLAVVDVDPDPDDLIGGIEFRIVYADFTQLDPKWAGAGPLHFDFNLCGRVRLQMQCLEVMPPFLTQLSLNKKRVQRLTDQRVRFRVKESFCAV